jgi:alpha-amylase
MNTNFDMYVKTAAINKARKAHAIWDHPLDEKYVTDNFYAFARGDFFVALTNTHNTQDIAVPNAPWSDGTEVCNIFYPDQDCQTIQGGTINVHLQDGESKIFIPKSSSFFATEEPQFLQE